jgi:serine/threonine-protein kinase
VSARGDERRLGEVVGGKYRVVRFLAAGGMGVVYEAQHTLVKRRFAVKFLRPELAEKRDSLARFQREAQTAGALESENLAAAVDFGVAKDGSPFIVMEYLEGESLEAALERDGHLPLERATDLVHQACRGIQAAHAASIVHRDLKPQNLFLCRREDGTDLLKVLDFGIAKLEAVDRDTAATLTGIVLGTPAYMSPEQARGERAIDHRADVYALGAILYELLSGRKPHPGDSHNAILHHIATQPAVPLDFLEPPLPAPLVASIERALSSDPAARFASAELFGQAVSEWAKRTVWPEVERVRSRPSSEAFDPTEPAPDAAQGGEKVRAPTVALGGGERDDVRAASKRALDGGERDESSLRVPKGALVALAGVAALLVVWLAARSPAEQTHDAAADAPPAAVDLRQQKSTGAPEVNAAERPLQASPVGQVNAAERPLPASPAAHVNAPEPGGQVNAAERPLAASRPSEPAPAPIVEPRAGESPRARATAPKEANAKAQPRATAPRPAATASAPALTFDRQNPYE